MSCQLDKSSLFERVCFALASFLEPTGTVVSEFVLSHFKISKSVLLLGLRKISVKIRAAFINSSVDEKMLLV